MSITNPTYQELYNSLLTWNGDYSVPRTKINYYLNLAEKSLIKLVNLPETRVIEQLTVVDNIANYPLNIVGIDRLGYDTDSKGRINYPLRQGKDFEVSISFTRLTGNAKQIKFFCTLLHTPYAEGFIKLDDFVDQFDTVQYSFFEDTELVLSSARYHALKEAGFMEEAQTALSYLMDKISEYRRGKNTNKNLDTSPKDDTGSDITLQLGGI